MKNYKKIIFSFLIVILLPVIITAQPNEAQENPIKVGIFKPSPSEHLVMATFWYQRSGEMRALYYQGYNLARIALDKKLVKIKKNKKYAVVVDIDETLLDNSPFEAKCIETGTNYTSESWKAWSNLAKAKALPGAVDFLNYAKSKGVEVFYISNRKIDEKEGTAKNLLNENFPYIDDLHFILKTDVNSKESRRQKLAKEYEILLLIGDNLADFDQIFENRALNNSFKAVEDNRGKFGDTFIILPNPMYGDWERPIFEGTTGLSDSAKIQRRKELLESY
jgi:5'-nucleotidase (lipoprotein e(P4) family)